MVQVNLSLICLSCCFVLQSGSGLAQESLSADVPLPPPVLKDNSDRTGLEFVALTRSAQGRAKPGSVVVFHARIKNWNDAPTAGSIVSKISGQSGNEFRRHFTLEAKQERNFDVPVLIPKKTKEKSIEVAVTLNVIEGGREVLLRRRNDEPASQTLPVSIVANESMTALYLHAPPEDVPNWKWPAAEKFASYEFAVTTRVEATFSRVCAMYDDGPLPTAMSDWDAIDVFIVSEPALFEDINAVATMQQFMRRGGRVWVMLDRIGTDVLRDLLEDHQLCETVDTVELNRFEVQTSSLPLASSDRIVDRDKPVKLKRVIQQGGNIAQTADGWPLAIWFPIGSGELLVTTLESDAWLLPNTVQRNPDSAFQSLYELPVWGAGFSVSVHPNKSTPPLGETPIDYPLELIGNPVVSFRIVGTVLVTFCGILLAFGLGRIFSRSDLSLIGGVAPAIAILASVPLIAVAVGMRRDIPAMVTKLQVAQLSDRGGGTLREQAAVYSTQEQSMKLASNHDGLAVPASTIQTGVRMLTVEDLQKWTLSNQNWPTGTWRYETQNAIDFPRFAAEATLTENGLSIILPQELPSPLEDAVVCFKPGGSSLGKVTDQGKRLLIDGQFEGEGERWSTNTIINDEQRRRAAVYNTFFQPKENLQFPRRTLYGWTQLWESPQWDVKLEQRGSALVAIPIRLATPQLGSKVLVPHSLVTIDRSDLASSPTPIYNIKSGRWADESTLITDATLSFVLPPEVVPLDVTAVHLDWDIRAPKRKVRLSNPSINQSFEIISLDGPSLPWSTTIKEGPVLEDLKDGRLELRIEIAERTASNEDSGSFVSWQVNHLRVSVEGKTLPRDDFAQRVSNGSTQ